MDSDGYNAKAKFSFMEKERFSKTAKLCSRSNLLPVRRGWGAESPKPPTSKKPVWNLTYCDMYSCQAGEMKKLRKI